MYRRAFLIFLSLFLLVFSSVMERAEKKTTGAERTCADRLHLISTGKAFSTLFHETSNCKD